MRAERRHLKLGTRIALTLLATILSIQALGFLTFALLPKPEPVVYERDWILAQMDAAASIFAADVGDRKARADTLSNASGLCIDWFAETAARRSQVPQSRENFGETLRGKYLAEEIERRVGSKVAKVEVDLAGPGWAGFAPPSRFGGSRAPPPPPEPEAFARDMPLWGHFTITLIGKDASRITIRPRPPSLGVPFLAPPLVSGVSAMVCIMIVSLAAARRWLKPIDHLVAAARKIGRERNATRVNPEGLGELAVVAEAMNEMQQNLATFVADRTQMLGAIAHDLRTSLTRLRLGLEALPEGEERLNLAMAVSDMESIVQSTIAFSSDDLKAEPSELTDLSSLVATCCSTFEDMGANVSYEGPTGVLTICQPVAVKRAVTNVIDNAVKYGKEAHVSLDVTPREITLTVRDRGPGIPEALIEEAFKPFRRIEQSRSRETGGVGLGLAIARDVMSAHGGSIRLANHPEGGLVARLEFPQTAAVRKQ